MLCLLYALILWFSLKITYCQLCDSKEYANNIEAKLKNKIGDKYSITRGGLLWLNNFTAWGNNPSGIYGMYTFSPSANIALTWEGGYGSLLYAHDAIIFAGCTPPDAKYFSTVPYLYNKYNVNYTWRNNKTLPTTQRITGALGAALNHLLINTTTNNAFDSLATIIYTGDNVTYTNIYDTLYNESLNDINLIRITNDYFNFAPYTMNSRTFATYPLPFDSFLSLWRIEIPNNYTTFYKYTKNIQSVVFYLKYNDQKDNFDDTIPFQAFTNDTCTRNVHSNMSVVNETKLYHKDFVQFVNDLAINISSTYNYSIINISQIEPQMNTQSYGYHCIDSNINCGTNNPDSVYYYPKKWLNITDSDYYIIVGVNSFKNNLTVYQSVCYMISDGHEEIHGGGELYALPDGVLNNFEYNKSTMNLNIKTNVSKLTVENFYVLQFARSHSFIPIVMGFNISYKDVNTTEHIEVMTRNYLHPLTKTKPDYLDLVAPMFITFKNLG